jgi:hypothetical protein
LASPIARERPVGSESHEKKNRQFLDRPADAVLLFFRKQRQARLALVIGRPIIQGFGGKRQRRVGDGAASRWNRSKWTPKWQSARPLRTPERLPTNILKE